jgi:hypothetical protein
MFDLPQSFLRQSKGLRWATFQQRGLQLAKEITSSGLVFEYCASIRHIEPPPSHSFREVKIALGALAKGQGVT